MSLVMVLLVGGPALLTIPSLLIGTIFKGDHGSVDTWGVETYGLMDTR